MKSLLSFTSVRKPFGFAKELPFIIAGLMVSSFLAIQSACESVCEFYNNNVRQIDKPLNTVWNFILLLLAIWGIYVLATWYLEVRKVVENNQLAEQVQLAAHR